MPLTLDELIQLIDVEQVDVDRCRGASHEGDGPRVFGGQVAAQALVAATRTVDADRRMHSLHCYFLRPGDTALPIDYAVDRIRDGRSFATRRIVASQKGEAIFNMAASYHVREDGLEHHLAMPADVPDPESLPTFEERMRRVYGEDVFGARGDHRPIDIRWCEPPDWKPAKGQPAEGNVWMRVVGSLPDDPAIHTALMVYASDYTLTSTVMRPHAVHWTQPGVMSASLDHSLWMHTDVRADQWWLYVQDSPAAAGSRGLARGSIFNREGRLVCSVAQEVLLRTNVNT